MPSTITDRLNGLTTSVAVKAPCRVATTANITLSGEQTIDDVAVVSGDRVLVKEQTSTLDNGIWIVSTGTWTRAPDFDGTLDVVGGTQLYVISGTVNGSTYWRADGSGAKTPATDSITFSAISGTTTFASDLASTATGKGAALSGFKYDDAGAVAETVFTALNRIVYAAGFGVSASASASANATALAAALAFSPEVVDLGGQTVDINSFSAVSGKKLVNGTLNWMGDGTQAILISGVSGFTLENVAIIQDIGVSSSATKRGVSITSTSSDIEIVRCHFEDFSREAVWVSASARVNIHHNRAVNCNRASYDTPVDATDDYGAFAFFANVDDSSINNNIVDQGGTGISVFGGSNTATDTCRNITISGNVCSGDIANPSAMGIYCLKNLSNIAITGNTIRNYYNEGIVVVNTDDTNAFAVNGVTITGNTVRGNAYAGISIEKGGGVAHTFRNVVISSNTVWGPTSSDTGGHGILLDNDSLATGTYTNFVVANNAISTGQNAGSATNWFGIYADHARRAIIAGNTIDGTWTELLRDEETQWCKFDGNNLTVNSSKVALRVIPPDTTSAIYPNSYTGNTFFGSSGSTSYLVDMGGSNVLKHAVWTGNIFHQGIIDLTSCENCVFLGNVMRSIDGTSAITNTGGWSITELNSNWAGTAPTFTATYTAPTAGGSYDGTTQAQLQALMDAFETLQQQVEDLTEAVSGTEA